MKRKKEEVRLEVKRNPMGKAYYVQQSNRGYKHFNTHKSVKIIALNSVL